MLLLHNELLEKLENEIGFKPSAKLMKDILGLSSEKIFYARAQRNSSYSDDEIEKLEQHFAISLRENNNPDCVNLDYFENVFGSCGIGTMVFDESKSKLTITKDTIKDYVSSNKYSVINAVGSSMSPAINDDDKVIIKHWNGEQIKDHRVYLFRYNDELFIKRLVKNIDEVICISENKEFSNRTIQDLTNFALIGEVVGLIREKV